MINDFCLLHPGGTNDSVYFTQIDFLLLQKMAAARYFPFKYGQDETRRESGISSFPDHRFGLLVTKILKNYYLYFQLAI